MVFHLITNIFYNYLDYFNFAASVLLGSSYLPPLVSARECLSACWPLAISVLLSCAYHLPTPPQSCCGVPTTNPCLLWSCQRVPVSLLAPCHLSPAVVCLPPAHAYSGPAIECLQPTTPTLVFPESAYQCLLVLPAGCSLHPQPPTPTRVLPYLIHIQPCSERLRCNNIQEEVSTLSSNLSLLYTLLPAFQGVSTLFSSLSTPDTPLPVLQRVSTLFSSLSSLKPPLQVLSSPNQTLTDSPRSLPHVILPTSSPALPQILQPSV